MTLRNAPLTAVAALTLALAGGAVAQDNSTAAGTTAPAGSSYATGAATPAAPAAAAPEAPPETPAQPTAEPQAAAPVETPAEPSTADTPAAEPAAPEASAEAPAAAAPVEAAPAEEPAAPVVEPPAAEAPAATETPAAEAPAAEPAAAPEPTATETPAPAEAPAAATEATDAPAEAASTEAPAADVPAAAEPAAIEPAAEPAATEPAATAPTAEPAAAEPTAEGEYAAAEGAAPAAHEAAHIEDVSFSFEGPFGKFDQFQLQRGLQVYTEVCSACHGLRYVPIRTLSDPGGPGLPEDQVRAYAANLTIIDKETGEERPRIPTDHFPTVSGDGMGPDLSLMAKSRAAFHGPYGTGISQLIRGIGGPEYIHGILTGYNGETKEEAGSTFYHNAAFSTGWIKMPPPLADDQVTYEDGTAATLDQMSMDVSAFLMWTAEPKMMDRKQVGFVSVLFLIVLAALLYLTNKKLWWSVKHGGRKPE